MTADAEGRERTADTADTAAVAAELTRFIADDLCAGAPPVELEPETDLIAAGVLDSMSLVRLVTFIEDRYGLRVADTDLSPDNFGTIAALAGYVVGRGGGR